MIDLDGHRPPAALPSRRPETAYSRDTAAIRVIGIGNEYAHDDAAGLLVARGLRSEARVGVEVLEQSGEGAALMESWKGACHVVVIDAARCGTWPGTVHRFDARHEPLPAQFFQGSTHAFGLYQAVEVARSLNQLPYTLIVYAIEGRDFAAGIGVSPEVEAAISATVTAVSAEF
jgi:hydrogenase maturation protease